MRKIVRPSEAVPFQWTPKREEYCRQYLVDLNGAAAARRAKFAARGAKAMAWELMQLPEIRARIQALMAERAERVEVNADTVLRELLRLATVDPADAFDEAGKLLPIRQMPEDVRRALAGIESGGALAPVKVKFWSKIDALTLLGKHLKLFTEVVQHEGLDKLADAMRAAEARLVAG